MGYVVYRVLGRVWQTLYGMTLLCVGLSSTSNPGPGRLKRQPPTPHLGEHFTSSDCTYSEVLDSHSDWPPLDWMRVVAWDGILCYVPTFAQ